MRQVGKLNTCQILNDIKQLFLFGHDNGIVAMLNTSNKILISQKYTEMFVDKMI